MMPVICIKNGTVDGKYVDLKPGESGSDQIATDDCDACQASWGVCKSYRWSHGGWDVTGVCGSCGEEFDFPRILPGCEDVKAVLSTTVLPVDGTYRVETLSEAPDIQGVEHYIGHPATKTIVEDLGAVQAPTKLFEGLQIGEQAVAFAIAQGRSSRATQGFTTPHQEVTADDLTVRVITRLD